MSTNNLSSTLDFGAKKGDLSSLKHDVPLYKHELKLMQNNSKRTHWANKKRLNDPILLVHAVEHAQQVQKPYLWRLNINIGKAFILIFDSRSRVAYYIIRV